MLCFLAFLRLLYVDWGDLDEVLLLLGLDFVLVLGDGLGVSDGASLRALLPAWKSEFKLRNASFSFGRKNARKLRFSYTEKSDNFFFLSYDC